MNYPDNINYFELRSGKPMSLNYIIERIRKFFPNYSGHLHKGYYPYRQRERFSLKKMEFKIKMVQNLTDIETGLMKTIKSRKSKIN